MLWGMENQSSWLFWPMLQSYPTNFSTKLSDRAGGVQVQPVCTITLELGWFLSPRHQCLRKTLGSLSRPRGRILFVALGKLEEAVVLASYVNSFSLLLVAASFPFCRNAVGINIATPFEGSDNMDLEVFYKIWVKTFKNTVGKISVVDAYSWYKHIP